MITDSLLRELVDSPTRLTSDMAREIIQHRRNKDSSRIDGLLASRTWRDPLIKASTRDEIDTALLVGNRDRLPHQPCRDISACADCQRGKTVDAGKTAADFLALPEAKRRSVIRKLKLLDDDERMPEDFAQWAFRRVLARGMSAELRAEIDLVKERG